MAWTVTVLDAINLSNDANFYDFTSESFVQDRLYVVAFLSNHASTPADPTSIATVGGGLTFAKAATITYNNIASPIFMLGAYWVKAGGAVTDAVRITLATAGIGLSGVLFEIPEATAASPIVQALTHRLDASTQIDLTPAALGSANNLLLGWGALDINDTSDTPNGTGWVAIGNGQGHNSPSSTLETAKNDGGSAQQLSWLGAGSADRASLILEIAAAGSGSTPLVRHRPTGQTWVRGRRRYF